MSTSAAAAGLTITGVAARTGLTVTTLRAWEQRHGFPRPDRLDGGHRRYSDDEVRRIEAVLAGRAAGLSLDAAIARATAPTDATIFAALRRQRPDLAVRVVSRRTMLAISRAIEDEAAARADRPHLTVAFQSAPRYRAARTRRWRALSRSAASTVVFADFARTRTAAHGVIEVAIHAGSPLEREWSLVCDGPSSAAVLAGWERPDGRFEAVWTVEASAVRLATDAGRRLADLPGVTGEVGDPADAVRRAVDVTNRIVGYLDA